MADGRVITQADLDQILREHKLWWESRESDEKQGKKADLSRAYLVKANLSGANLWEANLSGANMRGGQPERGRPEEANLSGAD